MKPVWILDADGIEFDNEEINNIFRTRIVDEFLENEKKLGIVAPRGLGKTFLIKAKRKIMQDKPGVLCLPEITMVDTISSPRFNESNLRFFENYENWKSLWKVSILISIFKQFNGSKCIEFLKETLPSKIPNEIEQLIDIGLTRTSEYFNYLLSCDRKTINIIFQNINLFDVAIKMINSSVCMFIDKVDQALSNQTHKIIGQTKMSTGPRNASFWQFAQLALADIAYELLSKNAHIKVYYSIRSEAFVDAAQICYTFQNFQQYCCHLAYSREELHKMFNQYINHEKDENLYCPSQKETNPSIAFLGIDEITCKYIKNTKEKTFDYILRHTFLRPRDIMDICYHLYAINLKLYNGDDLENKIREVVNRESQVNLETYISSTEKLLLGINREHIEYLCQLLNTNVMNVKYIKYVCRRLNDFFKDNDIEICEQKCDKCEELHPFCQLYNIGLIGYLWENRANEDSIRFFDQNDGIIINANHALPHSKYYFLHPCLASKAEHIRKNKSNDNHGFEFVTNILIRHGVEIKKTKQRQINAIIEKSLHEIVSERIFISSTCYDLGDERKQIDKTLSSLGYDVVRSDSEHFNSNLNGIHSHDHCINEMLECNIVLFIIGRRYGSTYAGNSYKKYVEEIKQESNGLIDSPSISFMEYYIARKMRKKIYVFVNNKVYDEKQIYTSMIKANFEYKPVFAEKNEIFKIINFISHQNVDNWFRLYSDIFNLDELIKITFDNFG